MKCFTKSFLYYQQGHKSLSLAINDKMFPNLYESLICIAFLDGEPEKGEAICLLFFQNNAPKPHFCHLIYLTQYVHVKPHLSPKRFYYQCIRSKATITSVKTFFAGPLYFFFRKSIPCGKRIDKLSNVIYLLRKYIHCFDFFFFFFFANGLAHHFRMDKFISCIGFSGECFEHL